MLLSPHPASTSSARNSERRHKSLHLAGLVPSSTTQNDFVKKLVPNRNISSGRIVRAARVTYVTRAAAGAVVQTPDTVLVLPRLSAQSQPSDRFRKCSSLSAALHISVQQALRMASRNSQVLQLDPTVARRRCGQLQRLLNLNEYEATALLVAHPALLLPREGAEDAHGSDLRQRADRARQLAELLDTTPATAMNALCRLGQEDLDAVMAKTPQQLEQQLSGLQAALFPAARHAAPTAGASASTAAEPGASGEAEAGDGAGLGAEEVLAARRRRLVCSLLLKWPSLLTVLPRQVSANIMHLVRQLRQPPRRVAVLAARVPLLLAEPHQVLDRRLAALAGVLRLGQQEVLQLLVSSPLLLREDAEEVQRRLDALAALLAVAPATAVRLVQRSPNLLRYSHYQLQRKLGRLAAGLKLSQTTAAVLAALHPPLLLSSPGSLQARVTDLGLVLSIPPARVVQMVLRFPRLLAYDVGKLQQHYSGLLTFGIDAGSLTQLLVEHPWLLLLPPAAVSSRTAALGDVFGLPPAAVLSMVWRNPLFLAKSEERVRASLQCLTQVLGVQAPVAVAALQQAPVVLSYDLLTCRSRCKRLRAVARSHAGWQQQLDTIMPDELATCLRYGNDTLQRLEWLAAEGLQGGLSLVDMRVRDPLAFLHHFPAYDRRATALQVLEQTQAEQQLPVDDDDAGNTEGEVPMPPQNMTRESVGAEEGQEGAIDSMSSRWSAEDLGQGDPVELQPSGRQDSKRSKSTSERRKWVGGRPDKTDFL